MHNLPNIDFIYLSEPDMIQAGVTNMAACVDTMEEMFSLMYHGDYRMAGPNNNSHGSVVISRRLTFSGHAQTYPRSTLHGDACVPWRSISNSRDEMVRIQHRE